ncbi:MAG: hypothetical protein L7T84_12670 [Akkermansiaceae bacterium]|nr:hypothetical protein [Akkermansiaceae bacterium]
MSDSTERDLESWITSRKKVPQAHLTRAVMRQIQSDARPLPKTTSQSNRPSWLIASACLLAGVGKLGLIIHLAF